MIFRFKYPCALVPLTPHRAPFFSTYIIYLTLHHWVILTFHFAMCVPPNVLMRLRVGFCRPSIGAGLNINVHTLKCNAGRPILICKIGRILEMSKFLLVF